MDRDRKINRRDALKYMGTICARYSHHRQCRISPQTAIRKPATAILT